MRSKNPELYTLLENFINEYQEKTGTIPSNAEISRGTGLSTASVSRYLAKMREDGRIEMYGHRGLRTRQMIQAREETTLVPILGKVACGIPKFAEENIEEYIRMPGFLTGNGEYFFLRANGDSMTEIGIDDGDLVLVKRQCDAEPGKVVVALIEDEATLKRFYPEPERKRIRLHPENREMNDIYVDHCEIQGIAVKVIKDII